MRFFFMVRRLYSPMVERERRKKLYISFDNEMQTLGTRVTYKSIYNSHIEKVYNII